MDVFSVVGKTQTWILSKLLPNQQPALCVTTMVPGQSAWNPNEKWANIVIGGTVWPVETATN